MRDLELLPVHLLLNAEDEVLQGAGNHIVGVEELVNRVYKFIIVLEKIRDFIGGGSTEPIWE